MRISPHQKEDMNMSTINSKDNVTPLKGNAPCVLFVGNGLNEFFFGDGFHFFIMRFSSAAAGRE